MITMYKYMLNPFIISSTATHSALRLINNFLKEKLDSSPLHPFIPSSMRAEVRKYDSLRLYLCICESSVSNVFFTFPLHSSTFPYRISTLCPCSLPIYTMIPIHIICLLLTPSTRFIFPENNTNPVISNSPTKQSTLSTNCYRDL